MDPFARTKVALLKGLLASGCIAPQTGSPPATSPSWRGDLRLLGSTWSVVVTPAPDGSVIVDVPSMWRAGEQVRAETFTQDRVAFDLPYSLGHVEGRIEQGRLLAAVDRVDGAHAEVAWDPWDRPELIHQELRVESDGVTVAATLVRPAAGAPVPAIVVLHGGGDSCRADSPPYRFWGEHLAELGFAVLLYDKRGNGDSTGNWRAVGFGERADDVVSLVAALARRSDVDSNSIGLLAVSQGGWVATLAARRSPRIAYTMLISCPAVSPCEADSYASWIRSRRAGLSASEADERAELWREYVAYLREGARDEDWIRLLSSVESARSRPWFRLDELDPEPRRSWFADWYPLILDFDPRPVLEQLRIPMLWIYGSADTQSDVGRNVAVLTQLRDRIGLSIDVAVLQGGDHGVGVAAQSLSDEARHFTAAPGFLETVDSWLRQRRALVADGVNGTPRPRSK